MRELEIRMWSKVANKYFTNPVNVLECLIQQNTGLYDHISDGMVFEQYTGKKDKNDKKIFAGDIAIGKYESGKPIKGVVVYKDCGYWLVDENIHYCCWLDSASLNDLEVIGTIHQKELLCP